MAAVANFVRTADRSYFLTGCATALRFSESSDWEMKETVSGYRVVLYVIAIRYTCRNVN